MAEATIFDPKSFITSTHSLLIPNFCRPRSFHESTAKLGITVLSFLKYQSAFFMEKRSTLQDTGSDLKMNEINFTNKQLLFTKELNSNNIP